MTLIARPACGTDQSSPLEPGNANPLAGQTPPVFRCCSACQAFSARRIATGADLDRPYAGIVLRRELDPVGLRVRAS